MSDIEELLKKGKLFLESGNYEEALSFFEQASLIKQNDPEILNLKGVALRSMGRYEEASECFNKSLEIDPRDKKAS